MTIILSAIISLLVLYILLSKFRPAITLHIHRFFQRGGLLLRREVKSLLLAIARGSLQLQQAIRIDPPDDPQALKPLTPLDNAEGIEQYENELLRALQNQAVQDVALTGPYGSGKSTILRTFFHRNPHFRPLYISLADFKDEEQADGAKSAHEAKQANGVKTAAADSAINEKIEYSILQQLFYHVQEKHIPFSRFKRIRPVSFGRVALNTLITLLFGLSLAYCIHTKWLPVTTLLGLLSADKIDLSTYPFFSLQGLALLSLSLGFIVMVFYIVRLCGIGLIKLSLQGAEIEISKNNQLSVLNKHMDEILYFFSNLRYRVLVLEDIDRFRNTDIFVKLREINRMLNNSLQVKGKVTFIYALRDDVFQDEERTKFFDLIIPVVPRINASNSADELIKAFRALELEDPIPTSMHNALAEHITDQRLIINIINEFKIYLGQLAATGLNNQRLLAMIVYKNLEPDDFSKLQENKGEVFELFKKKREFIAVLEKALLDQIEVINGKLHDLSIRAHDSPKALRMSYLAAYTQLIFDKIESQGFAGKIHFGSRVYTMMELSEQSLFQQLRNRHRHEIQTFYGKQSHDIDFSDVEKMVSAVPYEEHLKVLTATISYDRQKLTAELAEKRAQLGRVRGYTFTEFLLHKDLTEFKSPVSDKPCLSYLLRAGHIRDQDYKDYLSYFTPGQLSMADREFLSAVRNRRPLAFEHTLLHMDRVVEQLTLADCSHETVLNFHLLKYLLDRPSFYEDKCDAIIACLAGDLKKFFPLIDGLRQSPETFRALIARLAAQNTKFWSFMAQASNVTEEALSMYLQELLLGAEPSVIKDLDIDRILSDSISKDPAMLCFGHTAPLDKLHQLFNELKIYFYVAPGVSLANKHTVAFVYDHFRYITNPAMIDFFVQFYNVTNDLAEFNQGQLTQINASELTSLAKAVNGNLGYYVDRVYLLSDHHGAESPETILSMLNSEKVSEPSKIKVIEKTAVVLPSIAPAPGSCWDALLQNRRMQPRWTNVYHYYQANGITEPLQQWLGDPKVSRELANEKITESKDDQQGEMLQYVLMIDRLMERVDLPDETKVALSPAIAYTMKNIDLSRVGEKVLTALRQKLVFTPKTAISLKDNHPAFFHGLVRQHWRAFTTEYDNLNLTLDNLLALLEDAGLTSEQRQFIYEKQSAAILIEFLRHGLQLPIEIAHMPALQVEDDVLQGLPDDLFTEGNASLLIASNMEKLSEATVKRILLAAGGDYRKIAQRTGKEVRKSEWMLLLLPALQGKQMFIEKYNPKNAIIEITYLPVAGE